MNKPPAPPVQWTVIAVDDSAEFRRDLGDGRALWLAPLIFGWRLAIGLIGDDGFTDVWEYQGAIAAILAFGVWEPSVTPEPEGWYRHPASGRRRVDGDPAQEYIAL